MTTHTVSRFHAGLARAFALLPIVLMAPSCATSGIAQYEDTTVVIGGVARINFGHADINWWLLQGQMSSLTIQPEGTTQLASATLRVFEDANGNGTYDTGENQKSFTSTSSGSSLSISNVSLSAGDVSGWNTSNVSWQVDVTDASGHVYTTSSHL